jgi:hypothetical protein
MIRFPCPSGHQLSVDDSLAGYKVRCAECRRIVLVPGAAQMQKTPLPPPVPAPPVAGQAVPSQSHPFQGSPLRTDHQSNPLSTAGGGHRGRFPIWQAVGDLLRKRSQVMPPDVYEPGPGKVRAAYGLATILALAVAFSLVPVAWLGHVNPEHAPGWARAAVLLAVLQLMYLVWMINAPDWSSVWVVMLVFALVATAYAVALATALATPLHYPLMLGMGEVRDSAAKWCVAVLAVMSLATYLCGRASTRWNRSFRQEMARREHRRSTRTAAKGKLP